MFISVQQWYSLLDIPSQSCLSFLPKKTFIATIPYDCVVYYVRVDQSQQIVFVFSSIPCFVLTRFSFFQIDLLSQTVIG